VYFPHLGVVKLGLENKVAHQKSNPGQGLYGFDVLPNFSVILLVCVSVFRAIWGIFDQGQCREIRWKSFISPASPIAEQNGDCHKCLNGRMLQPDSQTNPKGQAKSPKFEFFAIDS